MNTSYPINGEPIQPPSQSGGDHEKKPWFGRNESGGHWGPRTWQGWLIVVVIVAIIVVVSLLTSGAL